MMKTRLLSALGLAATPPGGPERRWSRLGIAAVAASLVLVAIPALPGQTELALGQIAPTSPGTTAPGPKLDRAITFHFTTATFTSIYGGSSTGSASVSGKTDAGQAQLSNLKGDLNFPLKGYNLTLTPTGAVQATTEVATVSWFQNNPCCFYGLATFSYGKRAVPVGISFPGYAGNGNLAWRSGAPACVGGTCPPPGASYTLPPVCSAPVFYPGVGDSCLTGAVSSRQDAGTLNMTGPLPTIQ